jgi:hypothetical protein
MSNGESARQFRALSRSRFIPDRRGSSFREDRHFMNRRAWLRSASAGLVASLPCMRRPSVSQDAPYGSPYSLKFRHPLADLEVGLNQPPWNDPHLTTTRTARGFRSASTSDRSPRIAGTPATSRTPTGSSPECRASVPAKPPRPRKAAHSILDVEDERRAKNPIPCPHSGHRQRSREPGTVQGVTSVKRFLARSGRLILQLKTVYQI